MSRNRMEEEEIGIRERRILEDPRYPCISWQIFSYTQICMKHERESALAVINKTVIQR